MTDHMLAKRCSAAHHLRLVYAEDVDGFARVRRFSELFVKSAGRETSRIDIRTHHRRMIGLARQCRGDCPHGVTVWLTSLKIGSCSDCRIAVKLRAYLIQVVFKGIVVGLCELPMCELGSLLICRRHV